VQIRVALLRGGIEGRPPEDHGAVEGRAQLAVAVALTTDTSR
jgi:hypothetical protein